MPSVSDWKVPSSAQPKPEDYGYDLERALSAVVGLRDHRAGATPSRRTRSAPSAPATASSFAATASS